VWDAGVCGFIVATHRLYSQPPGASVLATTNGPGTHGCRDSVLARVMRMMLWPVVAVVSFVVATLAFAAPTAVPVPAANVAQDTDTGHIHPHTRSGVTRTTTIDMLTTADEDDGMTRALSP